MNKYRATKDLGFYSGGRFMKVSKGTIIDMSEEAVKQTLDADDYEIVGASKKKAETRKTDGE